MPGHPVPEATIARLRDELTAWFRLHQRDLPWRHTRDPYAIWVSEVMLQQTRVETVAPRYQRWLVRFPTVATLAAAPLDDVLAEWAGLGYYARARNLHAAAREVATSYGGRIPDDPQAVRRLPGIGRYTAGALLSLAFQQRAPILDGNVIRVLSRLFRIAGDPQRASGQRTLWALAARLVEAGDPGDINQGLMELGALVCTPRQPDCARCPLRGRCEAQREGDVDRYPERSPATRQLAIEEVAVALTRRGRLLLCRRPPAGLFGGLFELPSGALQAGEPLDAAAARVTGLRTGLTLLASTPLADFVHVLSHRRIRMRGVQGRAGRGVVRLAGYDASRWVTVDEASSLGVSSATSRLLAALRPRR